MRARLALFASLLCALTIAQTTRAEVTAVAVRTIVQNDDGSLLIVAAIGEPPESKGLVADRLALSIDGTPVTATMAPASDAAAGTAVLLAIDVSGSMASAMPSLKKVLAQYVSSLQEVDFIGVGTIGDDWKVVVPLTKDHAAAVKAIDGLTIGSYTTALFESVYGGTELLARADSKLPARRLMIVVSDGLNEKRGRTAQECTALGRDKHIDIHSLLVPNRTEAAMSRKGELETISRDTGGLTRTINDNTEIQGVVEELTARLQGESIILVPAEAVPHDGAEHRLNLGYERGSTSTTWYAPRRVTPAPAPVKAESATEPLDTSKPSEKRTPLMLAAAGLGIILVAAAFALRRKAAASKSSTPLTHPSALEPHAVPAPAGAHLAGERPAPAPVLAPSAPAAPRKTEFRSPTAAAPAANSFVLVGRVGLPADKRLVLSGASGLIGNDASVDVVLGAPSVSSVHAEFTISGHQLLLRDAGSTNGTFIGSTRIGNDFVPAPRGSVVKFGLVAVVVE